MSVIPYSTFRGWLKFHRPDTLNKTGAVALEFGLPGFNALKQPTPEMIEQGRKNREAGANTVTFELKPHRRFAGDFTLPKGCYYSICQDSRGDDFNCVVREMMAYRDPEVGPVAIFDLLDEQVRERLGDSSGPRHAFALFIKDGKKFEAVCGYTFSDSSEDFSLFVELPYHVEYRVIDKCIDLRELTTRDWFFDFFRLGDGTVWKKPNGTNISKFIEMLPTLMDLSRGGNDCTHAIGSWMRINGVKAFIFPSARANAMVTIAGGEVSQFYGWNLLDYSSARGIPPISSTWIDLSPWEERFGVTMRVAPEDSAHRGSWEVQGNEEYQDSQYGRRLGLA